jgi:hypothetical protein
VIELVRRFIVPAAYAVLPADLSSPPATRLVMAIGWQESRFQHRRQIGGPARGLWQFESAGVKGVLAHEASKDLIRAAFAALQYRHAPTPYGCHSALEHNDVLAAVFARLLLWTLPWPLPTTAEDGWRQYLAAWRPGRPHAHTWAEAWAVAGESHRP